MITAESAQAIALRYIHSGTAGACADVFVIQSCELSTRCDYWIVRANSEDYVVRGMQEAQYVGLNALLISSVTGAIEIIGSGQSVERYLHDKYDEDAAGRRHYILGPVFGRNERTALINLRQKLECSLQEAILLVSAPQNAWITGRLSILKDAQELLRQHGIDVEIQLHDEIANAVEIDYAAWHWDALRKELFRLIHILTHRQSLSATS